MECVTIYISCPSTYHIVNMPNRSDPYTLGCTHDVCKLIAFLQALGFNIVTQEQKAIERYGLREKEKERLREAKQSRAERMRVIWCISKEKSTSKQVCFELVTFSIPSCVQMVTFSSQTHMNSNCLCAVDCGCARCIPSMYQCAEESVVWRWWHDMNCLNCQGVKTTTAYVSM